MPIAGNKTRPRALPEFFRTFQELDAWRANQTGPLYPGDGVVPYVPRKLRTEDVAGKGRLLVSHDFKGGYVDDPFSKSYTFNWWHSTTLFNYFAHHRVSIPPPEWISAAHRQGVPVLGTIIFEGDSNEDCLRMVIGKLPPNTTGLESNSVGEYTVPVSPYYAELFANIAKERGFDGWLLNVEIDLQGGSSQARGLAAWITLFQKEVLKRVGPHGLVLWYDSVTIRGNLSWQERLSSRNLPFFLNSSGLFTNYSWYNHFPKLQVDYFYNIDPKYTGRTPDPHPQNLKKTVQDIYAGVDVWGRGSHGDGGFGVYKAMEHADPQGLGLSIALFAPGWTWESEETKPGWTWERFWEYDSSLWVGPKTGTIEVPPHSYKPVEQLCVHGPFQPIASFFPTLPPPDPLDMPFHTNFSPGIGNRWFVEGKEVFRSDKGWTDIDKQTSVGDLVWPRPIIFGLTGGNTADIVTNASLYFNDAWNGGNSLQINLTLPGGSSTYSGYWLPIQSFTFTAQRQYEASIVYKVGLSGATQFQTKLEAGIRSVTGQNPATIVSQTTFDLSSGWRKASILFEIQLAVGGGPAIAPSSIGFVIAVSTAPSFTSSFEFPFLVGQIAVHQHLPAEYKDFKTTLFWMTFEPDSNTFNTLDGTLAWEVVTALPQLPELEIPDREDTNLPWEIQPTRQEWFPGFLYFNVYAVELVEGKSMWIGTTGYDGEFQNFYVLDANLPSTTGPRKFTFRVDGVLETGEVTRLEESGASTPSVSAAEHKAGRSRRASLKSVLNPLRRKKSKGELALVK